MKIKYFRNSLEENKYDIKKTWTILKQAIGKLNIKSSIPQTFLANDIPVTDKPQVAEEINNCFSKIGNKLVSFCFTSDETSGYDAHC